MNHQQLAALNSGVRFKNHKNLKLKECIKIKGDLLNYISLFFCK